MCRFFVLIAVVLIAGCATSRSVAHFDAGYPWNLDERGQLDRLVNRQVVRAKAGDSVGLRNLMYFSCVVDTEQSEIVSDGLMQIYLHDKEMFLNVLNNQPAWVQEPVMMMIEYVSQ